MYRKAVKVSNEVYDILGELQQELGLASRHEVIKYLIRFYRTHGEQDSEEQPSISRKEKITARPVGRVRILKTLIKYMDKTMNN